MSDNLLLDLTPSEVDIIRGALRLQEQGHKHHGFDMLEVNCQALRSRINDAIIDNAKPLTRV